MLADQLKNPGIGRQQKSGKHMCGPIQDHFSRCCKREQTQRTENLCSFRVEARDGGGERIQIHCRESKHDKINTSSGDNQ